MITSWHDLVTFFETNTVKQYSRTSWDRFLKHVNFSYTIPSIHITGTNGKGSTALKLHDIYSLAGYRVGLFTSPSLESYAEMIQINGVPISETTFLSMMNEFLPLFTMFQLTTFEMQTYIAFMCFIRERCSFSVIEVGMGGLTDATNVFIPILSILTNVTLEHQAYLGTTIEAIAYQKSGIIKPGIPALVGPSMNDQALAVISQIAKEKKSKVHRSIPATQVSVQKGLTVIWENQTYHLKTNARYQVDNVATILTAVTLLEKHYPVSKTIIQQAFLMNWMPGRFESFPFKNKQILLDGAHNPGAIQQLIRSLPRTPNDVLFACFKDKDLQAMMRFMNQASWPITFTTFLHPRARKKEDYPQDCHFIEDPFLAFEQLFQSTSKDGVILITGSLAFIGIMRAYLKRKMS